MCSLGGMASKGGQLAGRAKQSCGASFCPAACRLHALPKLACLACPVCLRVRQGHSKR